MRIAVIQATSQIGKNELLFCTTKKYALDSEVFNFGCTSCDGESFSYIEISVLIGLLIASLLDTLDKKMIQKVLSKKDVIDFILENGSNSELLSWIEKQINDR